jgi:hypothetical protein
MNFELSHPATPQAAPLHASDMVRLARVIHHVELDYSPASLQDVDRIIEQFREGGSSVDDLGGVLFGFGCYLGEVMVRHAQGQWRNAADTAMADVAGFPIVIELPGQRVANPLHRVFRRLEAGPDHSLVEYYRKVTAEA